MRSKSIRNKKDTPTLLPKAVRCTLVDAQEVSSAISIAPDAGKTREIQNDLCFVYGSVTALMRACVCGILGQKEGDENGFF